MSILTSKINIERSLRIGHRWIALIIMIPLFITTTTGVLLLLRHQINWVQPPSLNLSHETTKWATIEHVKRSLSHDSRTHHYQWQDMGSVIYKPSKGTIQLRTKDKHLIQLDGTSAEVLSIKPRRTGWLIQLHEGSFWGKEMRLYVFFPAALGLWLLLISGVILMIKHYKRKWIRHLMKD